MLPGFSFYAWVPHVDPTYELLSIDVDVAVPASPGAAAVLPPGWIFNVTVARLYLNVGGTSAQACPVTS